MLAAVAVMLTGCATSTIESRRTERAGAYAAFTPEVREMVDQGRIKVGMTMDAVYISWGPPAQVLQSETSAGASTVWLYQGVWLEETRYWAHRWVGTGHRAYVEPYLTYDYQPRSYVSAEIVFVNGLVQQWRTLPQPAY